MKSFNQEISDLYIKYSNDDNIDEKDIQMFESTLKTLKKKIKEKNKPKTITISGSVHDKVKKYCNHLNLNIGDFTESVLIKEMKGNECLIFDEREYQEIKDEEVKKLESNWFETINSNRNLIYVKSDLLVLSKLFKFMGYSYVDGKPIYQIEENTLEKIRNIGYNEDYFKLVRYDEICTTISRHNTDDDILIIRDDLLEQVN